MDTRLMTHDTLGRTHAQDTHSRCSRACGHVARDGVGLDQVEAGLLVEWHLAVGELPAAVSWALVSDQLVTGTKS